MQNFVNLRKTASSWEFDSEEALEDFVWANLSPLFGIKYGNGTNKTSKLCAELYLTNKGSIIPFLWLPLKGLSSERLGWSCFIRRFCRQG